MSSVSSAIRLRCCDRCRLGRDELRLVRYQAALLGPMSTGEGRAPPRPLSGCAVGTDVDDEVFHPAIDDAFMVLGIDRKRCIIKMPAG